MQIQRFYLFIFLYLWLLMREADRNKNDLVQNVLQSVPHEPGVYEFYDKTAKLIYVGKARDLKKRVSSYFSKSKHESAKVETLVRKIEDIRYTIVGSESEAFLLENSLIKKHQPRYNIMLKDDKTYPWICIKNERFPRVFSTRNIVHDGSKYFGPYASARTINTLLSLITKLYKLRNCNHLLSAENIRKNKFKVCLEFHMGNCKGPCEDLQSEEDYNHSVSEIREIIKGNSNAVITHLRETMRKYASSMDFEKAQLIKEKLELIENFQAKSTVVNPEISNVDVFSIISDHEAGYVNYLKILNGAIVQIHNVELRKKLDESDDELLSYAIADIRSRFESDAVEVIVPFVPEMRSDKISFSVPKIGDKKKLLELSERNARMFQNEKHKQRELVDPEKNSRRILLQMQKDLRMNVVPDHIECFDNSNIQGDFAVAAMVVFKKAKPSKKEYRHYNIRTVTGPDDYASMEEVVYRRYKRVTEENLPMPDLIVIDGGKGQLHSALNSLEKLNLLNKVTVIGVAKKLEEIYFAGDPVPLYINKTSETLRVLQHIRDEAHRFGITHHRNKRSKETIKTELVQIEGIGKTLAARLLKEKGSVKKISEASETELENIIGKAKAKIVYSHYHP